MALDVTFQRCGIETKLIVGGKNHAVAHIRTVKAIQGALHKALKWNHGLVTGKYHSTREIADESGISQRYVAEMLKLAGLSPKITKAIFTGKIPATLSLVKLKRGFPRDWTEQETALGFGALHN